MSKPENYIVVRTPRKEALTQAGCTIVDQIRVRQDVGGPYPIYKHATLSLWSDGSVTWELPTGTAGG